MRLRAPRARGHRRADRGHRALTRFAVQRHATPDPADAHFDLLIEREGVLVTFRVSDLDALVALAPGEPLEVTRIHDHRLKYLDYEGPISGDRGSVALRDGGSSEILDESDAHLRVRLAGARLQGTFALRRQDEAIWTITRLAI